MNVRQLIVIEDETEFVSALRECLLANPGLIPAERACRDGGLPDPRSFGIHGVERLDAEAEAVRARFSVCFIEEVGAGCGGRPESRPRNLDCVIHIDRATLACEITPRADDSEPEPEF
jgi:hypothetical protein